VIARSQLRTLFSGGDAVSWVAFFATNSDENLNLLRAARMKYRGS